jgi:hypothetical protein
MKIKFEVLGSNFVVEYGGALLSSGQLMIYRSGGECGGGVKGGQAPLEQQVVNLKMADFPLAGPGSLMDADALPRPTYGLTPGPQELEVSCFGRGLSDSPCEVDGVLVWLTSPHQ